MDDIMRVVEQFFVDDEWPFTHDEDCALIRSGFKGNTGSWNCLARVMQEKQIILFFSVSPTNVPEEQRARVAVFLTMANYGLLIGNFEMDLSDGEVRYKTSIDIEGGELQPMMVQNMVYTNVFTMDKYLPGIMSVIYSDIEPIEALRRVEEVEENGPSNNGSHEDAN